MIVSQPYPQKSDQTKVRVKDRDEHSRLLRYGINYSCKRLHRTSSHCLVTFLIKQPCFPEQHKPDQKLIARRSELKLKKRIRFYLSPPQLFPSPFLSPSPMTCWPLNAVFGAMTFDLTTFVFVKNAVFVKAKGRPVACIIKLL